MHVSLVMNAINVVGNAIGIFVLHAGVAGVAWPSTISRVFAAVAMTVLCFLGRNPAALTWGCLFTWNGSMVRRLLGIAVPTPSRTACSSWRSGVKLHHRHVWHRADRRQWRGPEYLVFGGAGGVCHGPRFHHRGGTVHGRRGRGRRRLLHEKAYPTDLFHLHRLERLGAFGHPGDAPVL